MYCLDWLLPLRGGMYSTNGSCQSQTLTTHLLLSRHGHLQFALTKAFKTAAFGTDCLHDLMLADSTALQTLAIACAAP